MSARQVVDRSRILATNEDPKYDINRISKINSFKSIENDRKLKRENAFLCNKLLSIKMGAQMYGKILNIARKHGK